MRWCIHHKYAKLFVVIFLTELSGIKKVIRIANHGSNQCDKLKSEFELQVLLLFFWGTILGFYIFLRGKKLCAEQRHFVNGNQCQSC